MQSKSIEGGQYNTVPINNTAGMVQSKVECGISRGCTDFRLGSINISPSENIKKEEQSCLYRYGCKYLLQILLNWIYVIYRRILHNNQVEFISIMVVEGWVIS